MISLAIGEILSQYGEGKSNYAYLITSNRASLVSSEKGGKPQSIIYRITPMLQ